DDLLSRIDAFLEGGAVRLKQITRGHKAKTVVDALEKTREAVAAVDPQHSRAAGALCATVAELWESKTLEHLRSWGKKDFNKSESSALGALAVKLRPMCLPLGNRLRHLSGLEPERAQVFRRALAPLLAELQDVLRARGLSHFAHILVEAHRLFAEHPEVLRAARRKMRQLLVDEFQDTDVVQCQIVSLLAFGGPTAERPGLFVVGDPKQSIFGWRSADLAAYEGFLAQVAEAGGRTYPLVRNFRSAPVLLDEVSRSIRPVMREEEGLQPTFVELRPSDKTASASGFSVDRWAPVEVWPSWSPPSRESGKLETSTTESAEIEADAVATDIKALCLGPTGVAWKDICVLFRAMTRLEIFLDAFRRHGVPFVVTRDKQYFRRREIIDAAALVRTVVNPTDQVALLTWLRSPLVGVPDAALIPLWRHQFPRRVAELSGEDDGHDLERLEELVRNASHELPDSIPGLAELRGWTENLLAGLSTLALLRRSIKHDPADRFIERLRRTTLLEANEGARFLGQYRVANLDRFFRRLRASLDSTGGDVQAVLRALRRSVTEAHEAEEALPKDAAEDAIQVMTIHKAKGLEFKHVYVVQVDASSRKNSADQTDVDRHWGPRGPEEWSLLGAATLGFGEVKEQRRRVEAAEQVRLLYVAMTRACDRLVISGRWKQTRNAGRSAVPTFLSLLMKREGQSESVIELATRAA
ncbi:MAG: UvrD-helicase domain-containing protein, partial [Acidobacteriota bacterium]|nr:UvrD-helicase domain-containing protein [Acidobacteriota bacterium]